MILVPSQRSINPIRRELSVLERLSRDIMEEMCLFQELYRNGNSEEFLNRG